MGRISRSASNFQAFFASTVSGMRIAFLAAARIFPVVNAMRSTRTSTRQQGQTRRPDAGRNATMKPLSILDWYRILRAHRQWNIFQSIRYALWLAR
jgi:hypothetical protein